MTFVKRFKRFAQTAVIGGLAAVLPLGLLIIVFRWIVILIGKYLRPIVDLIDTKSEIQELLVYLLTIIAILGTFFLAGLFIQTRFGRFFNKVLEDRYLIKIPGYKVARDTVMQFFGKNKSFFSKVVLVDIFNSGTLMTGFITDDQEEIITVFVPTGPNPTSGNIYHVKREKVTFTTTPVDMGMKTIISCGAGSSEIFGNVTANTDEIESTDVS
ncbi:MAG TPA: hypothetical protein DDX98_00245 [Bacteroidales bacterium]|jgi:uncharacterized membrane protein|nr:hypothetical protein [Bacteroidales bacterium]